MTTIRQIGYGPQRTHVQAFLNTARLITPQQVQALTRQDMALTRQDAEALTIRLNSDRAASLTLNALDIAVEDLTWLPVWKPVRARRHLLLAGRALALRHLLLDLPGSLGPRGPLGPRAYGLMTCPWRRAIGPLHPADTDKDLP